MRAKAFTLMELLVVIVIVGVIAGFAIPSYQKTMNRQKVNRLLVTANLILAAQDIYKAKHGGYACCMGEFAQCWNNVDGLNSILSLNIVPESGDMYFVSAGGGDDPMCQNTLFLTMVGSAGGGLVSLITIPPYNTPSHPLNCTAGSGWWQCRD